MSLFKNVGIGSEKYKELQIIQWMEENLPSDIKYYPVKDIQGKEMNLYYHVNDNVSLNIIPDYIVFSNAILWIDSNDDHCTNHLNRDFQKIVKFYFDKYKPGATWGGLNIQREEIKRDYPKLFQVFPKLMVINSPDYSLKIIL